MPVRAMSNAEFAIINHRLGLRHADLADLLGVGERAVVRWAAADPVGPGKVSATKLRALITERDQQIDAYVKKLRTRNTRPIRLKRFSAATALKQAGSPHISVRAQDAFLADLTLALHREGIDFVFHSIED